jgi:SAM-dependent methyltransferase
LKTRYKSGIPTKEEYLNILESEEFKEMEGSSNQFLSENRIHLKKYSRNWVKDPLHQWSRQWEYPFVLDRLQSILSLNAPKRVLDAGSGITFFPYYLKSKYEMVDIDCCDRDQALQEPFQRINSQSKYKVGFLCSNLDSTIYDDKSFDCIYCISVLEHTHNYPEIVEEFLRILKPGGRLIVTFDVSLDGKHTITPENGELLLKVLSRDLIDDENSSPPLKSQLSNPTIFTTLFAKELDVDLLPWRRSSFVFLNIKSLLLGRGLAKWPPALTVFCLNLTKKNS